MRATACHRCGHKVWIGVDNDIAAFEATVDTTPLTVIGEALAVIDGRTTYAVDGPSRKAARRIWRRAAHRIGKPDPVFATLHAAHDCDKPIPAEWVATEAPTPTTATTNGEPQW